MNRWALVACMLLGAALPARALIVDGKEVEDIYEYILEKLQEDAAKQEDFRKQLERDPNFRGYRPYTYSLLSHLSTEDLLYGATQGGLAAIREVGPNAPAERVAAVAEANIQRVMELFPMLTGDLVAGETLLKKMTIAGRKDYMQPFILKRCVPGYANDSLFAAYMQDEVRRNRTAFVNALALICDDAFTETPVLLLALELYANAVEQDYVIDFEKDVGYAALRAQGIEGLTPKLALETPEYHAMLAAPDRFKDNLAKVRACLAKQLDPALQREVPVVELATRLLAEFDAAHPGIAAEAETTPGSAAPPMPEQSPDAPDVPGTEPPATPRIGIPTLGGF
jgi:hypothetical protein